VNLLEIKFSEGVVRYTGNFQVIVEGSLYPRQLQAANQIIQIYKTVTREDAEIAQAVRVAVKKVKQP
jgi:hypothetical protein